MNLMSAHCSSHGMQPAPHAGCPNATFGIESPFLVPYLFS